MSGCVAIKYDLLNTKNALQVGLPPGKRKFTARRRENLSPGEEKICRPEKQNNIRRHVFRAILIKMTLRYLLLVTLRNRVKCFAERNTAGGITMLKINQLTKHYKGSDKGVTDVNIHVEKGDIFAFIVHNWAGKTTTLKCITGIHGYDSGEIFINGMNLKENVCKCKKEFAYIPDNPDLYEYLTGIQYLNFVADVFEVSGQDRQERIKKYADAFEITESLGDLISGYSHGMKQKLALISALIHKPKLWILDEPFVGLDPKASIMLKQIMKESCKEGGAVFFSTHVLEVAEKLCNKVAVIKDGSVIASGAMQDVVKEAGSLEALFMEVQGSETN